MRLLTKRREFIAKTIADLGKAILTVGLASAFFERFPFGLRIALGVVGFGCLIASVFVHPEEE